MFINKGLTIDHVVTGADVAGNDMIVLGDLVGVVAADAVIGAQVVVEVAGKFKLPKDAVAIAIGKKCYLKAGTQLITGVATANDFIGYAAQAVVSGDATIEVILKQI